MFKPKVKKPILIGGIGGKPVLGPTGKPVAPQWKFSGIKMTQSGPRPVYRYYPYPPPSMLRRRKG